jgi:DNA-binding response OmpR family regulator
MTFRVVVVDDDPDVRRVVAIKLERAGFSVVTAVDAASGLAAVLREAPDVAVVDRMLPDGDGLELVGTLRATLADACPVIVVLSARTELAEIVEGIAAGADDYVTKPFSPRDLVERIRVALVRRGRIPEPGGPAPAEGEAPAPAGIREHPGIADGA